jgi:hypothetical protein
MTKRKTKSFGGQKVEENRFNKKKNSPGRNLHQRLESTNLSDPK